MGPCENTGISLSAHKISIGFGGTRVIADLSIEVPAGRFTAIVGANGSGKSTLLKMLSRVIRPERGEVLLDGRSIHTLPSRDVAKRLGLLPQSSMAPEGILVEDLVWRGRFPHQRFLRECSAEDAAAVQQALALTGISDLSGRRVDELSGGQRQRVWIAVVLAQETPLLLLDEPTTFLDIAHQVEVMELLSRLVRREGRTVIAVLHDLNQACRYADRVVALKGGTVFAEGPPLQIMSVALVEQVFGLSAVIIEDPVTGSPLIIPCPRREAGLAARGEGA
ncbi:ABC transporter ATP-binding protein [Rhizobium sp. CG5]|uniref:ABC transporter ATP-binding protein n=1 Tax=Rhizobium sp. CG5 TaxID=2726076 RepID=UPI0020345461|nr:ABC transporter ATP-binding protein [Rhizobium sp. CG5]MCM2477585.1 ABC transporter ATP-binding protein [Rhizobium sp. CG5]